jgi:hypothetical protein
MKLLAAAGSAAVGFGVLAFVAGFLAQRAQSELVQLPFVFIDYWAYAETGLSAFLDTTLIFIRSSWGLPVVAAGSIALVLALEFSRFKRWLIQPHWLFLSSLLVLWIALFVVSEQRAVTELRGTYR